MPAIKTDGASDAPSSNAGWDAVFAEGKAFGDSLPPEVVESLGGETPQADGDGSSAGAGNGSPETAPLPPTGDDGTSQHRPDPAAPPTITDPAAPPPETDPLAGAEPFTFTVDGKVETIEGAYRLPGDGLYVPEEQVPHFQLLASQAKSLDRQVHDLTDRNSTWERVTAWKQRDAQGNEQTLTGVPAVEASRVVLARTAKALETITGALADPASFAQLHDLVQDESGNWSIVRNDAAWKMLLRESSVAATEAAQNVRTHMATLAAPPPPPEPTVADMAMPTVDATISQFKVAGLTAEDKQFAASQLARHVRTTTQQERQQTGSARIVDESFVSLLQRLAALRAEQAKAVATNTKTDAFNTGMNKGRAPAAPPVRAKASPPLPTGRNAPKPRTEPSANDIWSALIEEGKQAAAL